MPFKWSLLGCHGMESVNWFCFEIQPAASFWGWEFVPNKNTSFMNLTPFIQEKMLEIPKYPSFWFIFELCFVSYRWWFQIYFFLFSPLSGEMIQFWRAYFSDGWFNHRLEKHFWSQQKRPSALKGGTSLGNFWPSWEGSDGIFGCFFCWYVFCWAAKELGSNNNISEKESKIYFCGSILGGVC